MKVLWIILGLSSALFGQVGQTVNVSQLAPPVLTTVYSFYNGSSLLEYQCASRNQSKSTLTITNATAATPGVFTIVGHGFYVATASIRPKVIIQGATGDWAVVNGTWLLVPVDADTFTLTNPSTGVSLDTLGIGGAISGTVTLTTRAPRINEGVWTIFRVLYNGSLMTSKQWAYSNESIEGNRCDQRAAATIEWR